MKDKLLLKIIFECIKIIAAIAVAFYNLGFVFIHSDLSYSEIISNIWWCPIVLLLFIICDTKKIK